MKEGSRTTLLKAKEGYRFEAKDKDAGEKVRCMKESEDSFFVFLKGRKKYGHRFPLDRFLQCYEPILPSDEEITKAWHKRIRRALGEIQKSGLWRNSSVEAFLLSLLNVDSYAVRREIVAAVDEKADLSEYMEKYPFMFTLDNGNLVPKFNWEYASGFAECKLKSMYFGDWKDWGRDFKGEIAEAIRYKRSYSTGRVRVSYDVSADIDYKTSDGIPRGWYSEEYRNTGNGHYYLMLSENCVIYSEDD